MSDIIGGVVAKLYAMLTNPHNYEFYANGELTVRDNPLPLSERYGTFHVSNMNIPINYKPGRVPPNPINRYPRSVLIKVRYMLTDKANGEAVEAVANKLFECLEFVAPEPETIIRGGSMQAEYDIHAEPPYVDFFVNYDVYEEVTEWKYH